CPGVSRRTSQRLALGSWFLVLGSWFLVVGRHGLDINIIGGGALPDSVDPVAGALHIDGGAAMGRLGREQRAGQLGLSTLQVGLGGFKRGQLAFSRINLPA